MLFLSNGFGEDSVPNGFGKDSLPNGFGKDSLLKGYGEDSQRCQQRAASGYYALAMLAHSSRRDLVRIPYQKDLLRTPYQLRTKWIW